MQKNMLSKYVINGFALLWFTAGLKTLFRFLMRSILLFVCFTQQQQCDRKHACHFWNCCQQNYDKLFPFGACWDISKCCKNKTFSFVIVVTGSSSWNQQLQIAFFFFILFTAACLFQCKNVYFISGLKQIRNWSCVKHESFFFFLKTWPGSLPGSITKSNRLMIRLDMASFQDPTYKFQGQRELALIWWILTFHSAVKILSFFST